MGASEGFARVRRQHRGGLSHRELSDAFCGGGEGTLD